MIPPSSSHSQMKLQFSLSTPIFFAGKFSHLFGSDDEGKIHLLTCLINGSSVRSIDLVFTSCNSCLDGFLHSSRKPAIVTVIRLGFSLTISTLFSLAFEILRFFSCPRSQNCQPREKHQRNERNLNNIKVFLVENLRLRLCCEFSHFFSCILGRSTER